MGRLNRETSVGRYARESSVGMGDNDRSYRDNSPSYSYAPASRYGSNIDRDQSYMSRLNLPPQSRKFLTLEDECNWILNGRVGGSGPLGRGVRGHSTMRDDRSDDEDTLDDISGDEVRVTQP